ncbi:hypothetical protein GKODMF_07325 [Candidatus Electrothrix gigas]
MGRVLLQNIGNNLAKIRIDKGFTPSEIKEMTAQRSSLINGIAELLWINTLLFPWRGCKEAVVTGEVAGICEVKPNLL